MRTKTNLASRVLIAVALTATAITLTAVVVNAQSSPASLSGTQWKGIYASGRQSNIPATLSIYSQNGSMMGTLTYDGYVETVAITANGPRALRMKGVSYKDTRGGRSFYLDSFNAEISADGHAINATGGDANSAVANEWLRLQRADSSASAAPEPASPTLARALVGSNWQGGIAESQKGATPAQLRIVQQGGGLNAILVYEQFEEVLAVTLTAPSGIQMRGTAYRDLDNQRRGFTLDTAQGEISSDVHTMRGTIDGRHFEFHRVN
jgi:hypothetical protein